MGNAERKVRLCVIGPFRAEARTGQEIRVDLRRAKALLAVLALTPSRQRSRSSLQGMFWSRNGSSDGAQNLRTALRRIRVALGEDADCLVADGTMVSLARDRVEVDIDGFDFAGAAAQHESNRPVLLEDMDGLAEPDFEDWLRDQRSAFDADVGSAAPRATHTGPPPRQDHAERAEVAFWLRMTQPFDRPLDASDFYANVVAGAIAQGVAEHGVAEIATAERETPGINLQIAMLSRPSGMMASVSLIEAHTQRVLWTGARVIPADSDQICEQTALMRFVNQMVDITIYCFRNLGSDRHDENAFTLTFDAINRMFKLGLNDLLEADRQLDAAFERKQSGLILAWKAYLRTFLVGEHHFNAQEIADEVRALSRRAIELSPVNTHTLALTSYVHSFILYEYHAGMDLARRSIELGPGNPLGHAFLGAAAAFHGQPDQAMPHLARARELCGPGPYSFTIDFLAGAVSTLAGKFDEAIYLNEVVRQTKPEYKPSQRFLTALYHNRGQRDAALAVMHELRRSEPDFSFRKMQEPDYPSSTLRAAGLITADDPDFG